MSDSNSNFYAYYVMSLRIKLNLREDTYHKYFISRTKTTNTQCFLKKKKTLNVFFFNL